MESVFRSNPKPDQRTIPTRGRLCFLIFVIGSMGINALSESLMPKELTEHLRPIFYEDQQHAHK
jgi:hypothetical protein